MNTKINELSLTPEVRICNTKRKREDLESILNADSIKIKALVKPSLEKFNKEHFQTHIPVKLQGRYYKNIHCIDFNF